ncbi:carboxy terminal-processing peptidase [Luteimonas sp. MC1825]|uniref:carboxy terminal-processing peptidase n=1 Tax=Luteimonas sp. MC1825 TaxID=2761107 RepID=UPI00161717B5|nr:carboxy terminal-processing peptidase [Luteimonas sp. MC1825]MBB6600225.1 carboxy terminal-processing peptidase [Luteimonas sp. MC1825]QOC87911.1 carboxy terminal-processing peptidase [Luteimonas sp. MC1825]
MKARQAISISAIVLALATPLALMARADGGAIPAVPTADHATTSKLVYGLLSDSRYAYRPRALDAAMSADIFKRYLESLDGNKLFLSAGDVARFARYEPRMGDAVRQGDVGPAFEIFALYKQRVDERVAYARGLLKQDIFDFNSDERWYYDREDAPWAADGAELDGLWRKSVRNDWLRLTLAGKSAAEIRATLDKRYANIATSIAQLNGEDAFQSFLNAYTASIDPHTDYFNPRTAKLFTQSMSLSLEGIGAQLQRQDDVVVIRELIPGGPAATSNKFTPGDRIVGVGQGTSGPMEDVIGWRIDDVVEKIKGKAGTQVRLDVVPVEAVLDSAPVRITLTRAKVRLEEQAAKSKVLDIPGVQGAPAKRIGVIELPAFYQDFEGRRSRDGDYASATRDVARILGTFRTQAVDGVVLDLRSNGGGSLNEAVELTGLFIDQGPVVQVRESGGRVSVEADRKAGVSWDGPLAVLVNRGSASASEIVAGAIQDYGRGLVIGETTFGKGTVQNLVDLDRWPANEGKRYGQVKLTIAQFFLPGGSSTQNRGVVPDISFPVTVDASVFGESTYDNALPWTRIAAVPHTRYGNFAPLLPRLDALHAARVAKDHEFRWFSQDVAEFRAESEKKYISLNVAERRAERDRQDAKRKERQAERKRLGLQLDPLADIDSDDGLTANERDIAQDTAREAAAEKRPDPLLRESAAILADAVRLLDADRKLSSTVLPESTGPGLWAR